MPYDKGDFTQQGVNGDVSALVRLNDKRVVKMVLSSDDESSNVDVSGTVYDYLNGETYPLGGSTPTGTITITENGTGIDIAEYRLADVNVPANGVLISTTSLGHLATTATSNTDMGTSIKISKSDINTYDVIIAILKSDAVTLGYNRATVCTLTCYGNPYSLSASLDSAGRALNFVKTNDGYKSVGGAASIYGIFPGPTISYDSDGDATLPITGRYSSSYTGTIDGNYTAYLYGLTYGDFIVS